MSLFSKTSYTYHTTTLLYSILLLVLSAPSAPLNAADDDLFKAIKSGKIDFGMRYRYEHVEDDAGSREADASTLRTTLGYKTASFHGFSARIQFQDVRDIGIDDFNDATGRANAKTQFAVVADPSDTDLSMGNLSFTGLENTEITAGRQLITYRKPPFHRFIGTVGWRQNWQNHDAITIKNKSIKDTTISYAYSWNVNRIFSERAIGARANFDSDSHLVNVQYAGLPFGKLEAYAYLLEFDNAAAISVDTFGVRFSGAHNITDSTKALYAAEYATQDEADNNPNNISADYFLAEIGANFKLDNVVDSLILKFNYELFEGKGGANRFLTPLATAHAYQGWADRFLVTPGDGIEDFYFTAIANIFGAKLIIAYHDLNSDNQSYSYGDEIDIQLTKKFKKHYTVGVKYASYNADNNATSIARNGAGSGLNNDVEKFWVFGSLKF